jgi:hypothetical protein
MIGEVNLSTFPREEQRTSLEIAISSPFRSMAVSTKYVRRTRAMDERNSERIPALLQRHY